MNVLITGAAGFIGSALCIKLSTDNKIIGVDITKGSDKSTNIVWEQADLTDRTSVVAICEKHSPDVVIHCAGIAHQKIGAVDSAIYMRVNSEATENLARAAAQSNPDVCFVFLSSVSIYGEGRQEIGDRKDGERRTESGDGKDEGRRTETGDRRLETGISEDGGCWPSSDYAVSKLDAERRLIALYDEGTLRNLVILRLAPVYDRDWSLNLDRRVFAPGKVAYLRFGSGSQRMSALARPNLVDFIAYKLGDGRRETGERNTENRNNERRNLQIFNVCDAEAYEFNRIIRVFKKSGVQPNRPVISVPLSFVWIATRLAGLIFRNKQKWVHSCYDKLASDLVFDNGRMMGTGFRVVHSLETIMGNRKQETGGGRQKK
jgi:nucleoside-diphosphate-sugar epimerase